MDSITKKKRFPPSSFEKLKPQVNGPFRIIKKINDNSYQIDLPGDSNVLANFNIAHLTPYYRPEVFPTTGDGAEAICVSLSHQLQVQFIVFSF